MNDEEKDLKAIYDVTKVINYQVVVDAVTRLLKNDKKDGPLTISEASYLMFQDLGY